jgi:ankyrin repeat protein
MDSASTGNCSLLEQMLSMGIDVNVQAEDGYTALHCAAKTGQVAIIRLLLWKGAAVDSRNAKCHQRRPIHEAISAKHVEAIATLLRAGADVLLPDPKGRTVIDYIGIVGDVRAAQTLLSTDRQIGASDMASLLTIACVKSGNHLTLSWLLSQFPNALSHSMNLARSPIYTATKCKNKEIVAAILSSGGTSSQSTPEFIKSISRSLVLAMSQGSDDLVQRLLMCDTIEPNQATEYELNSPLHIAIRRRNLRVVKMLLSHPKIDVNIRNRFGGETPLHHAVILGQVEVIKLLLLHKDIDVHSKAWDKNTLLGLAFFNYKWTALRLIADHQNLTVNPGPNITLEDTPTAPLDQHWPLICLLLNRGILSKSIVSWSGLLEKVIVAGETETEKFLVDYMSLNVNGFDDTFRGTAILHVAAQHHRHEIFRLYLEDPWINVNNPRYWRGYTVLQGAIKHNCMTAVKLLLARPETDLRVQSRFERLTALDLARKFGKREMFELLLSHGAVGQSLEMDPTIVDEHAHEQSCWTAQDEEELQGLNAQSNVVEVGDSEIEFDSGECEDVDMSI